METTAITLDRDEARERYRDYQKHLHYAKPIDQEIARAYHLLAQGRLLIRALDSVAKAGLGADGFPKLAIARADAKAAHVIMRDDGGATMTDNEIGWRRRENASPNRWFDWAAAAFPVVKRDWRRDRGEAMLPLIPLAHRPQRGIENYHVLWEAEWSKVVPRDPYLLRRIGKGDMWLVVAMWDLTEVERTALQARINS